MKEDDTKRQILYDTWEVPRVVRFIEIGSKSVVGRRGGVIIVYSVQNFSWKDKVLATDSGENDKIYVTYTLPRFKKIKNFFKNNPHECSDTPFLTIPF